MFKNIKSILVNLHLFDGEGEMVQAGSENNDAANASQQTQGETVVYGKEIESETQSQTQQQGEKTEKTTTDTPDTQEFNIDFSKIPQEKRPEVFKQFKEAFKEEYTQEFNNHFDRRFKEHKEQEAKLGQYEPIIQALMKYHNVNDIAGLQQVIDTDVMADLAEQEGFSDVNKYKEYLAAKRESENAKAQLNQVNAEKANQDRINRWVNEGVELKKTYPDFDLSKEILKPEFAERLQRGMSVTDAYTLTHINDIIANASKAAAKKAEENTVTSIKSKSARIPENGTKPTPGVIRKTDPSKLTDKDLAEIARRVERGEKISF
jgi:hypothetical protein